MALRIKSITFDCADPYRLAQFWSQLTGFVEDPDNPNSPDDPEGVLLSPDGSAALLFIAVPRLVLRSDPAVGGAPGPVGQALGGPGLGAGFHDWGEGHTGYAGVRGYEASHLGGCRFDQRRVRLGGLPGRDGKVPAVYEGLADVAPQRLAAGRLAPRHRHRLVEEGVVGPRPLGAFGQSARPASSRLARRVPRRCPP